MLSARDVVASIGLSLFRLLVPGVGASDVQDLFLAEPHLDAVSERGDLVLGVGLPDVASALTLIEESAKRDASGLILRLPLGDDVEVQELAGVVGLPLIGLQEGVSWTHVISILRHVLDHAAAPGASVSEDASVHGDLFRLADAAAGIIGAPVTIEDSQSRVLAYSSEQQATDEARISTILGRRVPSAVLSHYRARGVYRRLATATEPFYVPAGPDGTLPRVVVPVQVRGEWLGSIWGVVDGPMPEERLAPMKQAASVLALHLLRLRAQADLAQRGSSDRLRAALRGSTPGLAGLLSPPPWRVVAFASEQDRDVDEQQDWLTVALRRHGWRDPFLCSLEGVLYALVRCDVDAAGSWPWLQSVATSSDGTAGLVRAAAGGRVTDAADLPRSRAQAFELRELLASGAVRGRAADFESNWAATTVSRAVAGSPLSDLSTPVDVLQHHDVAHGTSYVDTLGAWLTYPAAPQLAANHLHVHPNTLRHRMGRLAQVVSLDLSDPEVRLALLLHVRRVKAHARFG